jgi:hypothetical protein
VGIANSGLDKVEEEKIKSVNPSELEPRILKVKKIGDESALAEDNIDEVWGQVTVNSETTNVDVNKCVKVSKSMYAPQCYSR